MKIIYTKKTKEEILVDDEVYDYLNRFTWRIEGNKRHFRYALSYKRNSPVSYKQIKMHRCIMGVFDPAILVDHINGNTLDNRKENLRTCTRRENCRHRTKLAKNNTSGIHGVYWHTEKKKWQAKIKVNYKHKHLGYFITKEDAGRARKEAEIKYFGEFRSEMSKND